MKVENKTHQSKKKKNDDEILDKYKKIKENYKNTIQDKDKEIEELKKQFNKSIFN